MSFTLTHVDLQYLTIALERNRMNWDEGGGFTCRCLKRINEQYAQLELGEVSLRLEQDSLEAMAAMFNKANQALGNMSPAEYAYTYAPPKIYRPRLSPPVFKN